MSLEVVREAIARIASQPFVTRRALLIGQNLIEHAAVSGVSFEQGSALLDALLDAGLRDPMWLEHAPVFKYWRRDPSFAARIARARASLVAAGAQRAPA